MCVRDIVLSLYRTKENQFGLKNFVIRGEDCWIVRISQRDNLCVVNYLEQGFTQSRIMRNSCAIDFLHVSFLGDFGYFSTLQKAFFTPED